MEHITDNPTWSTDCLSPLAGNACGINPLYHDDFEAVKIEIEKIGDCQYLLVIEQCSKLLTQTTKDLRVAGYLCLALACRHQSQGLLKGLKLYRQLLCDFGTDLHPQSENARRSALKWLNNPRFTAPLSAEELAPADALVLIQTISELNETIESTLGKGAQRFTVLDEFLQHHIQRHQPEKESQTPEVKPQNSMLIKEPELKGNQQAMDLHRQLVQYWQKEKQWLLACQLARSLRWAHLTDPSATLPAPRKEALLALEKALKQDDPEQILQQCESLFLEPGGQYLLDLHYHASEAAKKMGEVELAHDLLQQTKAISRRFPQLLQLNFQNGMPFASSLTRHWLDSASQSPEKQREKEKSTQDFLNEAQTTTAHRDLAHALLILKQQKPASALEGMRLLQAKAQLCQQMQRQDLAMVYYQELLSTMDSQQLLLWHPEEAVLIWKEILTFIENKGHISLSAEQLKTLIFQLKGNICREGSSVNI